MKIVVTLLIKIAYKRLSVFHYQHAQQTQSIFGKDLEISC